MGAQAIAKPRYNPYKEAYKTATKGHKANMAKETQHQEVDPKDHLTKQGYFNGARYIWIPKNKKGQEVPKQQGTSLDKRPAEAQTKLKWIPKGQKAEHATNTQTKVHRKENKPAKLQKKATALEKGKWVPKVACKSIEYQIDQAATKYFKPSNCRHACKNNGYTKIKSANKQYNSSRCSQTACLHLKDIQQQEGGFGMEAVHGIKGYKYRILANRSPWTKSAPRTSSCTTLIF